MTGCALLLSAACWLILLMLAGVAWVLGGWPAVAAAAAGLTGFTVVVLAWPVPRPAGRGGR